jgi:gluconate 2-dehydrogenase alpha chain
MKVSVGQGMPVGGPDKVVPYAHVTTVAVDERTGRVTGVHYVSGGEEYFQPADVVLLASYTYENVRLLPLSKSKPFPDGLSNNAGQVGKHYMTHNTASTLAALFPFDLNNWYGLPAQGIAVDNWADDNLTPWPASGALTSRLSDWPYV